METLAAHFEKLKQMKRKPTSLQDSIHKGVEANHTATHQGVPLEGSSRRISPHRPYEANITDMLDISLYEINSQPTLTQRFATGRE